MNETGFRRVLSLPGFSNKKKLFEKIAEELCDEDVSLHKVLDGLNTREKMGSTCIGKGVAIPHCKLDIESPRAVLIILDEKMSYSEHSEADVDIILGLLVPVEKCDDHLHLLSSVAKLCENDDWLDRLRCLESEEVIINHIAETGTNLEILL